MKNILLVCFNKVAPIQQKRIKGKVTPWLTRDITIRMNIRDQLLRRYRKHKVPDDWDKYKKERNSVNRLIKKAKSSHHKKLLQVF